MAISATPKTNATAFISASAAAYWTVSSGAVGNLKEVALANTSSTTAINVTLYNVPTAASASSGNMLCPPVSIPALTMVRIPFNTFLAASASLQAVASSANAVTITVSGLEYA